MTGRVGARSEAAGGPRSEAAGGAPPVLTAAPPDAPDGSPASRTARAVAALDRPLVVAVVAGLAMLCFAAGRLVVAGEGDVTSFVVAGANRVDPPAADHVRVIPADGYDGQYAYRLALDPLDLEGDRNGVEVDGPTRWGRIAYPALAWLAAAGRPAAVPWALVGVNIAGLALLAGLSARLARRSGLHAAWGLLVAGWGGLVVAVARDLTEVVAAVGVVGGLLAWQNRRPAWAAGALTLAVLAREGTLIVVAAVAAVRLAGWLRGRSRPAVLDAAWLVPAAAFVAWQGWCGLAAGEVPVLASLDDHVAAPSVGAGAQDGWLGVADTRHALLKGAQVAVLVVAVVLAAAAVRRRRVDAAVVVALGLAVVLAARVWAPVWNDWAGFRAFTDVYVLAVVALMAGGRNLRWLALGVAPVWGATAVQMAVVL